MDEKEITRKLEEMDQKLDEIYKSSEKTRKYILTMLILSVLVVVLPLLGLIVVIPQFLSVYGDLNSSLGL